MVTEKKYSLPPSIEAHFAKTGSPGEEKPVLFFTGNMSDIENFVQNLRKNIKIVDVVASAPDVSPMPFWATITKPIILEGKENLFGQMEEGYENISRVTVPTHTAIIFGNPSTT